MGGQPGRAEQAAQRAPAVSLGVLSLAILNCDSIALQTNIDFFLFIFLFKYSPYGLLHAIKILFCLLTHSLI